MGADDVARQPSPHVHAKQVRRREEILRAALRAFRERGYHATTLDHIAQQLGVRKTALYHYFADKDAILYACHRESLAELERIVAEARELPDPAAQLRHVIVEHVRVMTDALDGSPLAFEVPSLAPSRQAEILAGRDAYERELRLIVERGIRSGAFRRVDSKLATFVILGAINWVTRGYRPDGAFTAAAIGEQFAGQLVGGLEKPSAPVPARRRTARDHAPQPRKATS